MEIEMRLHSEPFDKIKFGKKKTEIRLNDAKRKKIRVGDSIIFSKRPDLKEKIKVKITSKRESKDYSPLPKYYTLEGLEKYGIVVFGIELK